MAKEARYSEGKYDTFTQTYSHDHRQWGNDLYYCDVDGVEWMPVGSKWYPVAIVEECHASRVNDRSFQLARYCELADALSSYYGYRVHAFFVKWTCNLGQPEGERIETVDVTCLATGARRQWTRERWVQQLRTLRDRVRKHLSGMR